MKRAALGCFAALLAFVALTGIASGAGGTYEVVQCHDLNRAHTADSFGSSAYVARDHCVDGSDGNALKIENARSVNRGQGRKLVWAAPPGLAVVGVHLRARLQRHDGHIPRLYMADASGAQTHPIASGDGGSGGFRTINWDGPGQKRFVASLVCETKARCHESSRAKTWLRNIRLEVADLVDPEVEVGGRFFGGGWMYWYEGIHGRSNGSWFRSLGC